MLKEPSDDTIIWRYLSLDKFIDLLISKSIKFTLASIASDKNELKWILQSLKNLSKNEFEKAQNYLNVYRNSIYISCWTMKEDESNLFWNNYLDSNNQGVAIKTKVGKFKKSLIWHSGYSCKIVDYRNEFYHEELQNPDVAIFTKNTAYKDESEIRFRVSNFESFFEEKDFEDSNIMNEKFLRYNNIIKTEKSKDVLEFNVNLETLIEEIKISPYCSKWQEENIKRLIKDYQINLIDKITKSTINE